MQIPPPILVGKTHPCFARMGHPAGRRDEENAELLRYG